MKKLIWTIVIHVVLLLQGSIQSAAATVLGESSTAPTALNTLRQLLFDELSKNNPDIDIVRVLLAVLDNVNTPLTNIGSSPLWIAAEHGHLRILNYLITQGADVNKADNRGVTPLIIAAQRGHAAVMQLLIMKGAQVNQADNNGVTPLYAAAQNGYHLAVQELIDADVNVNQADNNGVTPLYLAVYKGNIRIVQELLKTLKINVNNAATLNNMPLYCAAELATEPDAPSVYYEIMKLIIDKDKNAQGLCGLDQQHQVSIALESVMHGWTAVLDNMVRNCKLDLQDIRNNHNEPLLLMAIKLKSKDVLNYLLSVNSNDGTSIIDVNTPVSHKKITALMVASELNEPELMQILISHKINIDAQDTNGETALLKAIKASNLAAVELLIRQDADIDKISTDEALKPKSNNPDDRRIAEIVKNPRDFRLSFLNTDSVSTHAAAQSS